MFGSFDVDGVHRRTVRLRQRIDLRHMLADEAPIGSILRLGVAAERHGLGSRRKLAERGGLARCMLDHALLDGDLARRNLPGLGRCGDDAGAGFSARLAQLLPRVGHGGRAAGALDAKGAVGVQA